MRVRAFRRDMADSKAGTAESNDAVKKIVVLSNARDLAASWVKSMSGGADTDSEDENQLAAAPRPHRLGLGAMHLPHALVAAVSPVDKKLRSKLNIQASRFGRGTQKEDSRKQSRDAVEEENQADSSDDDGEPESRASAFNKRIGHSSPSPLLLLEALQESGKPTKKKRKQNPGSR